MKKLQILLLALILIKALSLGIYNLYDSTEARYAGIAFRMADSNNFITPKFLPDEPFLAKPPLSFWACALSFKIFHSYHEFFARLPYFLAMLIVLFLGFIWVKKIEGVEKAYKFGIIFASTIGFTMLAGSVMTDGFLLLGITMTNMGFFYGLKEKKYGYLFFLGLTVSVLSKGLIGVVLSGIPCFIFVLLKNKWKGLLNLPILGFIIFLILTLPWFYLMEKANSGFLEYFFIGEHFKRFLVSGWEGDKYGYAHKEPLFMIIIFFIICSFQWFFYACFIYFKNKSVISFKKLKEEELFLLLTFALPLLFFSFSKNIIIPYATVSIVSFCILLAIQSNIEFKILATFSLPLPLTSLIVFIFAMPYFATTDKTLIQKFNQEGSGTLYYLQSPDFNAYFYSRDKIKRIKEDDLKKIPHTFFVSSKEMKEQKVLCNKNRCLYKK